MIKHISYAQVLSFYELYKTELDAVSAEVGLVESLNPALVDSDPNEKTLWYGHFNEANELTTIGGITFNMKAEQALGAILCTAPPYHGLGYSRELSEYTSKLIGLLDLPEIPI